MNDSNNCRLELPSKSVANRHTDAGTIVISSAPTKLNTKAEVKVIMTALMQNMNTSIKIHCHHSPLETVPTLQQLI